MGEKTIDMRGRPCPEPVVATRKALAEPGTVGITVLVDNRPSAENVTRMAESMGWSTGVEEEDDGLFRVSIARGETDSEPGRICEAPPRVVVFVASAAFGEGSEDLGGILMRSFIKTLRELEPLPECVIFANGGVRLTTEGSDLIEAIRELEERGVRILSCGTCLDYFHLKEKLLVGSVSNMYEIAGALASADRLVRP